MLTSRWEQEFRRLGIGIDRPESRDSDSVAKYVLGRFNEHEKRKLQGSTLQNVLAHLKTIASTRFSEAVGIHEVGPGGEKGHVPNPR